MTSEERRARSIRVKTLMENGDVQTAFDEVHADLIAEWQKCFDADEREKLWHAQRGLVLLRDKLTTYGSLGPAEMAALRRK